MKRASLVCGLLFIQMVRPVASQTASVTHTSSESAPIAIPAESAKWIQVRPGQEISALWGDRATGPNGRFNRFAAGFQDRPHFHTRDLYSIVVSGTLILETVGMPKKELGPGSYTFIPARTPHTHSCKAGNPCVVFVYQDGPSDSISTELAK